MFSRIKLMWKAEGPWAFMVILGLLRNRLRLLLIRTCIQVPDVYFQGPPKIVGRRSIVFGKNFQCGSGAWIEAVRTEKGVDVVLISIGSNVTVSRNLHIGAMTSITIGNGVLIGSDVLIIDHNHGSYSTKSGDSPDTPPNERNLSTWAPISIGENVWIGDGVKILPGATIGSGSVIAAGTVVKGCVPEKVIFGNSEVAVVLKTYNAEDRKWIKNNE